MILLVTCDLKTPNRRSRFLQTLEFMGLWCRLTDSTFLLSTNRSQQSVAGELSRHCDSADTFSVEEFDRANAGPLPEHAQRWLELHPPDTEA